MRDNVKISFIISKSVFRKAQKEAEEEQQIMKGLLLKDITELELINILKNLYDPTIEMNELVIV